MFFLTYINIADFLIIWKYLKLQSKRLKFTINYDTQVFILLEFSDNYN